MRGQTTKQRQRPGAQKVAFSAAFVAGAEARAEGSARAVTAATPVLPLQKPKRKATRAPAASLRVHVCLEVLAKSGTDQDREHAAKILPVVENQHRLLCTLLIYNAAAMEALPIFLDSLVTAWDAILISATSILLFGVILILILLLMEKWWTRTEKGSSYFSASLPEYETSASMQFAAPVKMGIYNRPPPLGMWNNEAFRVDSNQTTSGCMIMEADTKFDTRIEEVPQVALEAARSIDQEASKPPDKVLRRLAQNREAARKSRLRKKAYVQQLETSRMKLAQLEQELQQARQQGVYVSEGLGDSPLGLAGSIDPGVAAFEIEYNHWVDEQNRHTGELRTALQGQTTELELRMLVETGLSNYDHLFRIKAIAANSDVFYIMSGMWKTPAERFFLWLGGFRPSEVLKILSPQLEPLTDQQVVAVCGLQQTSTQAEDALLQGMEKLQQTLAEALVATDPFGSSDMVQMANAVEKLKALACFVVQADHLRQTTLQQMHKILTTRQAARGLLALGDYFQRLRALSSLWATRPREPAISKM